MSILPKFSFKNASSGLSKMLLRILNLESSLFPILKEELRLEELSHKEQKLIKRATCKFKPLQTANFFS